MGNAGATEFRPGKTNYGLEWEQVASAAMGKEGDKSSRDLLLDLVHSDMNMARAYAAVARSKYDQGKVDEGDFARLKA